VAATKKPKADGLSAYRAKRSLDRTPEPGGAAPRPGGRLFVVHKHAATRMHFDLRLEMEGVLQSWAVPKGPSADPQDKRLAVHVENHPIEYGDFEGLIPAGNYGAGAVILWDRGSWVPVEDPVAGLVKGKLLFELRGYKLKGIWTLVKLKKGEKDWLLIKERDAYVVKENGDAYPQASVLSGLTVEELRDGANRAAKLALALGKAGAPRRDVDPEAAAPMLAEPRDQAFSKAGWLFEVKLDGYRLRASRKKSEARLLSRNAKDYTAIFPEIARAVKALPFDDLLLDGELVVLDDAGRPSFQLLQNRARTSRIPEVRRESVEHAATYYVFDLLAAQGFDARPLPLEKRKTLLQQILPPAGPLKYSEHFPTRGEELYEQVVRMGLEGVVAKKADSPYREGRSPSWLKIRADRTDDFVVAGFTRPKGSRAGFGALQVAGYENGKLVYAGRVGSGFTAKELEEIAQALDREQRPKPPFAATGVVDKDTVWVTPTRVVEVRYKEWTGDQLLRHPVFLRFRDDKKPDECVIERRGASKGVDDDGDAGPAPQTPTRHSPRPTPHEVVFSNLEKIFWPAEGYTKGDLVEYYRAISPWLLPWLKNRPVVLTRYPDGIEGKSFFQKDAPAFTPEWLRTVRMWSEQAKREIDYFVCDDLASLLYLANLASIPLHIWASTVDTLEQPDWCVLDLDPKGAPMADVVAVARACKKLCDDLGLPAGVKASGSTGLHVLVPLGRQCTYEQSRTLGGLLARVIVAELPEIATVTRQVGKRGGRVYLDYVQNGHGRLLVSPYSVRPLPGAPVSVPLKWSDVTPKLDIRAFTIKNAPARMKRVKEDPLIGVLGEKPDLVGALERLHARLD